MCDIKASQIFKINKESKSKQNVLQMIKAVFDEMAAVRAEREDGATTMSSARAPAAAEDDAEDDLEEYETFLEELYSPSI
jgi:hypothetical protein